MRSLKLAGALAAGVLVCGGISSSQAAPLPAGKSIAVDSMVEKTGYCGRQTWKCRARWGWGWRYRRCMRRHGC